jgi:hypothetical protein
MKAAFMELVECWWIPRLRFRKEERHHGGMAAGGRIEQR